MKTLKEFLSERAEIERGRADDKKDRPEGMDLGRTALEPDQIKKWLQAADKEHLLEIEERSITRLQ